MILTEQLTHIQSKEEKEKVTVYLSHLACLCVFFNKTKKSGGGGKEKGGRRETVYKVECQ